MGFSPAWAPMFSRPHRHFQDRHKQVADKERERVNSAAASHFTSRYYGGEKCHQVWHNGNEGRGLIPFVSTWLADDSWWCGGQNGGDEPRSALKTACCCREHGRRRLPSCMEILYLRTFLSMSSPCIGRSSLQPEETWARGSTKPDQK